MLSKWFGSRRVDNRTRSRRGSTSRPELEGLESRLLLYSTLGANWTYGSRITYSLVPDGTNIAGLSSNLYSTLNAKFATATWQAQFQKAAATWEAAANINLVQVSDNGTRLAGGDYQQGDPGMGDIRISMASLPSGQLATTFLPPPINGGSDSGDIVFNSNINWQINSNYDLMTVALHEFGHALGMDHSTYSTADMYATYTGVKQSLTADDIAGIQSIYGAPQNDMFETGPNGNNNYTTATNITPYINGQSQIALSGLNISATNDQDWYYVTVPAGTTGKMSVTMQSSNLSSLSPAMGIYTSGLGTLAVLSAPNVYGATLTVNVTGVTAGQGFYIRALAASNPGVVGAYGLLVNFGSYTQSPIAPPYTQVLDQLDYRGGSASEIVGPISPSARGGLSDGFQLFAGSIQSQGNSLLSGWGDIFAASPNFPLTLGTGVQVLIVSVNTSSQVSQGLTSLTPTPITTTLLSAPTASSSVAIVSNSSPALARGSLVLQAVDDALTLWNSTIRGKLLGDVTDSDAVNV